MNKTIWIFNGEGALFPSGVFNTLDTANHWIVENSLSGVLTEYPVDTGVYDWAVSIGYFSPNKPQQQSSKFIGKFTSSHQNHFHYENGAKI